MAAVLEGAISVGRDGGEGACQAVVERWTGGGEWMGLRV